MAFWLQKLSAKFAKGLVNLLAGEGAVDYAKKANDFYNNRTDCQVKVDSKGITMVYDSENNIFASYNAAGTTKTMFSPMGGQAYFDFQPGQLLH